MVGDEDQTPQNFIFPPSALCDLLKYSATISNLFPNHCFSNWLSVTSPLPWQKLLFWKNYLRYFVLEYIRWILLCLFIQSNCQSNQGCYVGNEIIWGMHDVRSKWKSPDDTGIYTPVAYSGIVFVSPLNVQWQVWENEATFWLLQNFCMREYHPCNTTSCSSYPCNEPAARQAKAGLMTEI